MSVFISSMELTKNAKNTSVPQVLCVRFMSSVQLTKNAKNTSVPNVLFVHLINSVQVSKNAKNTSVPQVLCVRLYRAAQRAGSDLLLHLPRGLVARWPQPTEPPGQLQSTDIARQDQHSQADGSGAGAVRRLLRSIYQYAALGHMG